MTIARIIAQDVDAAELLHRLLDGRFRSCLVGKELVARGTSLIVADSASGLRMLLMMLAA